MDQAGNNVTPVFPVTIDMVPSSIMRTWLPDFLPIYGEFTNANGKRQVMRVQRGSREPVVLTNTGANEYDAAVSPDSRQLVFISDRDGNPEIYLQTDVQAPTDQAIKLTETTGCSNGHPIWLPDGSGIVYESNCQDGNWEIYRASLAYSVIGAAQIIAQPFSPRQVARLTTAGGDDHWPRVSPDGSRVAFFSNRDGNQEIYTMTIDGGSQLRLTTNPDRDEAPSWSPDGSKIVFNSNRDGDFEIFSMNRDGSGLMQLTNNSADDGFAVWGS
jgi:Tol biopolymer transport system component